MNTYRVTIPPFEVEASDSFEAEAIVDDLIESGAYDYEIEDITELLPRRGSILVRYTEVGYEYELDLAHTSATEDGWTSTRWRPRRQTNWISMAGFWPRATTTVLDDHHLPTKEAP